MCVVTIFCFKSQTELQLMAFSYQLISQHIICLAPKTSVMMVHDSHFQEEYLYYTSVCRIGPIGVEFQGKIKDADLRMCITENPALNIEFFQQSSGIAVWSPIRHNCKGVMMSQYSLPHQEAHFSHLIDFVALTWIKMLSWDFSGLGVQLLLQWSAISGWPSKIHKVMVFQSMQYGSFIVAS